LQDPFISDWDGFDYTVHIVQHKPSTLGLGRALFLGYNSGLWELAHTWAGLSPEKAYLALRYGVIAQAGAGVIGVYALCKELTASRLASFFGALIVSLSPYYIIYSGRAMSEVPGLLALSWSLWWMARSLRTGKTGRFLAAAALLGLSANIREFAVFYFPFIPVAARIYRGRWRTGFVALLLAVACAFVGMIFWKLYDDLYWGEVVKWYRLSAAERRIHPVTSANLWFFADYAFNCSVVVLVITPLAVVWLWSRPRLRALAALGLLGLAANLALLANHDLAVNPRYLLTGLLGLAAACGWCLAELIRRHRVWAAPLLVGLIVLTKGSYNHMAKELIRPAVGGESRARLRREDNRPPLGFRVHRRRSHAADPFPGGRQGAALLADHSSRVGLARRQTRRGDTGFLLRGPQSVRGLRPGALAEGRARNKPRSRGT
jgi:hypothetical protein